MPVTNCSNCKEIVVAFKALKSGVCSLFFKSESAI